MKSSYLYSVNQSIRFRI